MRCKKEEFVKGAIFHIYNHSVAETDLFREIEDYLYFLQKLKKRYNPQQMDIYAYCLMPNHFHFCIKQKNDEPVYKLFNSLNVSYAHHFNSKYKRKGKVFADKLQHKQIKKDNYLIQLCKYIHYNPVKACLVKKVKYWEFSNYLAYTGNRNGTLFSKELIAMYPDEFDNYANRIKEYEKYIKEKEFTDLLFD